MQYAQKRIISGFFCIFMVSVIIFNSYERKVYADAGTIAVAGGSIAVGGLGAGALAGLSGPVVVGVMLAGLAWGIDVELTKASENAGMTKTQFVKSKINDYCNEANITAGVFNKAIIDGMNVFNDGRISLTNKASAQIKQFYDWLFENNDVVENTGNVSEGTVNLADYNMPYGKEFSYYNSSGNFIKYSANVSGAWYCVPISSFYTVRFIVPDTISNVNVVVNVDGYQLATAQYSANNYVTFYSNEIYNTYSDLCSVQSIPIVQDGTGWLHDHLTSSSWNPSMDTPISNDTFTGSRDDYNTGSQVLNPSQGQTTVINPGLIGQVSIPADKDYTIDVRSYLEALEKILDKLNDITIPAVDDATDMPVDVEVPDTVDVDPDIAKEDDTDLPVEDDQTPVIDDNPIDPSVDPILAAEPLKFDLRNIFPFCIPFDIKDMLSKLSAEPVAPSYTVNWHIPIVNTDLVFTVDLSSFNNVASILRNMELIAFIIGLAFITRSLIRG